MNIVSGLHRSGTTYVGEILKRAGVSVVHEPLNERFGMAAVPVAYPFVGETGGQYAQLLDDALGFQRPWNTDAKYLKKGTLGKTLFRLTGGKSGLRWRALQTRAKLGMAPARLCFKDPFSSLATPYLLKRHDCRIVCMVRHPGAIHQSTEKQNWSFDVANLRQQRELIEAHGSDISPRQWQLAAASRAAAIALLWKFLTRINFPLAQSDDRLLVVTHEALCREPLQTSRQVCAHFGLPLTRGATRFVRINSQGDNSEGAQMVHDFRRDSRGLVDLWRKKISPQDLEAILEVAGDEIRQFEVRSGITRTETPGV